MPSYSKTADIALPGAERSKNKLILNDFIANRRNDSESYSDTLTAINSFIGANSPGQVFEVSPMNADMGSEQSMLNQAFHLIMKKPEMSAAKDDQGNTLLHLASRFSIGAALRALAKGHGTLHCKNNSGETPLTAGVPTWDEPSALHHYNVLANARKQMTHWIDSGTEVPTAWKHLLMISPCKEKNEAINALLSPDFADREAPRTMSENFLASILQVRDLITESSARSLLHVMLMTFMTDAHPDARLVRYLRENPTAKSVLNSLLSKINPTHCIGWRASSRPYPVFGFALRYSTEGAQAMLKHQDIDTLLKDGLQWVSKTTPPTITYSSPIEAAIYLGADESIVFELAKIQSDVSERSLCVQRSNNKTYFLAATHIGTPAINPLHKVYSELMSIIDTGSIDNLQAFLNEWGRSWLGIDSNGKGHIPFCRIIEKGRDDLIKWLLESKDIPEKYCMLGEYANDDGFEALCLAAMSGNLATYDTLFSSGTYCFTEGKYDPKKKKQLDSQLKSLQSRRDRRAIRNIIESELRELIAGLVEYNSSHRLNVCKEFFDYNGDERLSKNITSNLNRCGEEFKQCFMTSVSDGYQRINYDLDKLLNFVLKHEDGLPNLKHFKVHTLKGLKATENDQNQMISQQIKRYKITFENLMARMETRCKHWSTLTSNNTTDYNQICKMIGNNLDRLEKCKKLHGSEPMSQFMARDLTVQIPKAIRDLSANCDSACLSANTEMLKEKINDCNHATQALNATLKRGAVLTKGIVSEHNKLAVDGIKNGFTVLRFLNRRQSSSESALASLMVETEDLFSSYRIDEQIPKIEAHTKIIQETTQALNEKIANRDALLSLTSEQENSADSLFLGAIAGGLGSFGGTPYRTEEPQPKSEQQAYLARVQAFVQRHPVSTLTEDPNIDEVHAQLAQYETQDAEKNLHQALGHLNQHLERLTGIALGPKEHYQALCHELRVQVGCTNTGIAPVAAGDLSDKKADALNGYKACCTKLITKITTEISHKKQELANSRSINLQELQEACQTCNHTIEQVNAALNTSSLTIKCENLDILRLAVEKTRSNKSFKASSANTLRRIQFDWSRGEEYGLDGIRRLIDRAVEVTTILERFKEKMSTDARDKRAEEDKNEAAFRDSLQPQLDQFNTLLDQLNISDAKIAFARLKGIKLLAGASSFVAEKNPLKQKIIIDPTKSRHVSPHDLQGVTQQIEALNNELNTIIEGASEREVSISALIAAAEACNKTIVSANLNFTREANCLSELNENLENLRLSIAGSPGMFSSKSSATRLVALNLDAITANVEKSSATIETINDNTTLVKDMTQKIKDENNTLSSSIKKRDQDLRSSCDEIESILFEIEHEKDENLVDLADIKQALNRNKSVLTSPISAQNAAKLAACCDAAKEMIGTLRQISSDQQREKQEKTEAQALSALKEKISRHVEDVNLSLGLLRAITPVEQGKTILLCDRLRRLVDCHNSAIEPINISKIGPLSAEKIKDSISEAMALSKTLQSTIDQTEAQNNTEYNAQLQKLITKVNSCNLMIDKINDCLKLGYSVDDSLALQLDQLRDSVETKLRFSRGSKKSIGSCLQKFALNKAYCRTKYPEKATIARLLNEVNDLETHISGNITDINEKQSAKIETEANERAAREAADAEEKIKLAAERLNTIEGITIQVKAFNEAIITVKDSIGDLDDPFVTTSILPRLNAVRQYFRCGATPFSPLKAPDFDSDFYDAITQDDAKSKLAAADVIISELEVERRNRMKATKVAEKQYINDANFEARWEASPQRSTLEKPAVEAIKAEHNSLKEKQKKEGRPTLSQLPSLANTIESHTQSLREVTLHSNELFHAQDTIRKISAKTDSTSESAKKLNKSQTDANTTFEQSPQHLSDLKTYSVTLTNVLSAWQALSQHEKSHIEALQKSCSTLVSNIKIRLTQLIAPANELAGKEEGLLKISFESFNNTSLEAHKSNLTALLTRLDQALTAQTDATEKASSLTRIKAKLESEKTATSKLIQSLGAIDPEAITHLQSQLQLINESDPTESDEPSYYSGILGQINQLTQTAKKAQSKTNERLSSLRSNIAEITTQIQVQLAALQPDTRLSDTYQQLTVGFRDNSTLGEHQQHLKQLKEFSTVVAHSIEAMRQQKAEKTKAEQARADAEAAKKTQAKQEAQAELQGSIEHLDTLVSTLNRCIEILPAPNPLSQIPQYLVVKHNKLVDQLTPSKGPSFLFGLFSGAKPSNQLKRLHYSPAALSDKDIEGIKKLTKSTTDIGDELEITAKSMKTSLKAAAEQHHKILSGAKLLDDEKHQFAQLTVKARKKGATPDHWATLLSDFATLSNQAKDRLAEEAKIKHLRGRINALGKSRLEKYQDNPAMQESIAEIGNRLKELKKDHATSDHYAVLLNTLQAIQPPIASHTAAPPSSVILAGTFREPRAASSPSRSSAPGRKQATETIVLFRDAVRDLQGSLDTCYDKTMKQCVTRTENQYFDRLRRLLPNVLQNLVDKPTSHAQIISYNHDIMNALSVRNDNHVAESIVACSYVETADFGTKESLRPEMLTKIKSLEIKYCDKYCKIAANLKDLKGQAAALQKLPITLSP
jgi:hypothetical protein